MRIRKIINQEIFAVTKHQIVNQSPGMEKLKFHREGGLQNTPSYSL